MNSSSFSIQSATLDDLNDVTRLNSELFVYEDTFGSGCNLNWPYSSEGQKGFAAKIIDGLCFIAKDTDGKSIGYICGGIDTDSSRIVSKIGEISNIFVKASYRGNGVGKALVKELIQTLQQKGITKIGVNYLDKNTEAITFYESLGFQPFSSYSEMDI